MIRSTNTPSSFLQVAQQPPLLALTTTILANLSLVRNNVLAQGRHHHLLPLRAHRQVYVHPQPPLSVHSNSYLCFSAVAESVKGGIEAAGGSATIHQYVPICLMNSSTVSKSRLQNPGDTPCRGPCQDACASKA